MARDAILVRQETAQKIHVSITPMRDLDEILGADNGGAQDQQQDLRQWVDDLGALPRVFQGREVVQQSGGVGWVIHGGLRIGNRQESCFVLYENPPRGPNQRIILSTGFFERLP